jgi:hypothetical protein
MNRDQLKAGDRIYAKVVFGLEIVNMALVVTLPPHLDSHLFFARPRHFWPKGHFNRDLVVAVYNVLYVGDLLENYI